MTVGKAIYYLLTNATDVTDIVSTRIYPEIAQQDADLPYIVYNVANNEPTDTKPEPSKLDTAQVEVNIYSDSYTECIDLAVAVRAALDRVKGTYNGVNVQSIQYLNEIIDFDEPQRAYNISADYDVRISRTDFEIAQGSPITGVQLGELSDVDVDGVTNGQLIAYNSTSGNWEAADDAGGAETIGALNDVAITTPADREALIYDGGNWVNDNISKSDVGLGNVDNTSDADKPVSSATQTALDAKADTSAVPTELNDLSDVTIAGTPAGNEALIYDTATSSFKSLPNFTNRFEDEAENNKQNITPFAERVYTVKADGDGIFIDAQSDTPTAGKVIERKIYHKAGFLENGDVIGDFTLIHTFADDTAYSATTSTFEGFRDGDTYGTPPFTLIQTWEEQTAAPAFTGLLNESYGSGAAAAYSVRRLNGLYTGSAIQVERSSDNTTQDIGFDSNGDLDESALTTFCTGTTCKVRTWYDQSVTGGTGSGNDAVQTVHANQPTIYTGGAIVRNTKNNVTLQFDGTDKFIDILSLNNDPLFTTSISDYNGRRQILGLGDSTAYQYFEAEYDPNGEARLFFGNGSSYTGDTLKVDGGLGTSLVTAYKVTDSALIYVNGTTTKTAFTNNFDSTENLSIAARNSSAIEISEVIAWQADKVSDRTSIESNIGDYFTQNTPLLDTYTGAAAAYSLRKLRTAYTGSAIRVRRASDNTEQDIGFNVFGELDTVSLASFCSGTDGFVKTWYDQSGNANDATQTTAGSQPKIYDSSTGVVTENGKPAVQFDGSNDSIAASSAVVTGAAFFCVNVLTMGTTGQPWGDQGSLGVRAYQASSTNLRVQYNTDNGSFQMTGDNSGSGQRIKSTRLISGTQEIFDNGSLATSATNTFTSLASNNVLRFGMRYNSSTFFDGKLQEFVLYTSDQSSNRTNIEGNINTFYSIY